MIEFTKKTRLIIIVSVCSRTTPMIVLPKNNNSIVFISKHNIHCVYSKTTTFIVSVLIVKPMLASVYFLYTLTTTFIGHCVCLMTTTILSYAGATTCCVCLKKGKGSFFI